jgi:predicted nucleotidyltransferase
LRRLNEAGVRYVLIGGVAAIVHGSARITEDLDIFGPLDHANAVAIIRALSGLRPRWRHRPDLPVITPDNPQLHGLKNMYLSCDLGLMDVLGEVPEAGTYVEVEARSEVVDFRGLPVRVVDLGTLITIKRAVGRDKDVRALPELELLRRLKSDQDRAE